MKPLGILCATASAGWLLCAAALLAQPAGLAHGLGAGVAGVALAAAASGLLTRGAAR